MIRHKTYNKRRTIGEVFVYASTGRKMIKTEDGIMPYAVYVAKQNPDICGQWFEGCDVHHIDGDRYNDEPTNLRCLSKEQHQAIHKKKVEAYFKGNKVGEYESITSAERETGVNTGYISACCLNKNSRNSIYRDWWFTQKQENQCCNSEKNW